MPWSTAASVQTRSAKALADRPRRQPLCEGRVSQKADLAKLLLPHLFIRCALQFLGPGLVDDMGDLLFGQLATKPFLLTLDPPCPVVATSSRTSQSAWIDAFDLKSVGGFSGLIPDFMQAFDQFIAIDFRSVVDRAKTYRRFAGPSNAAPSRPRCS